MTGASVFPASRDAAVRAVRAGFGLRFGRPPCAVGSAPGRVNLLGEHTDYNGGWVLPFAIQRRTYAAGAPRGDELVVVHSATLGESAAFPLHTRPGDVSGWVAYVAGVVWAFQQRGYVVPGVELYVDGDVQQGAGLASSAALECAVAMVLAELIGSPTDRADMHRAELDRAELAALAQRAENDYVGVPSGGMDQLAALYGQVGHVLLIDMAGRHVEPVAVDFAAAGLAVLVIDTTVRHRLADGAYAQRRAQCAEVAVALGIPQLRDADARQVAKLADPVLRRRARHVVTENARVLAAVRLLRGAAAKSAAAVGRLLTASHRSLRDDFEVSVTELDLAVDTALGNGALGARLTGAGFGGCALALVPGEGVERVSAACSDAFDARGFAAPHCFVVLPASGARLEPSSG